MRIKGIKKWLLGLLLVTVMLLAGMAGCRKSSDMPQGNAGSGDAAETTQSADGTLIEGDEGWSSSSPDITLRDRDGDGGTSRGSMGRGGMEDGSTGRGGMEDGSTGHSAMEDGDPEKTALIDKDGVYTSKEDVSLYIYTYGELPENFITKKEAKKLGWPGGSLEDYAPGKCIGGDTFGNFEGLLPEKKGRRYYECDIDTLGRSKRGAKRIIFSNDGLIYYTEDHYGSFELLYDKTGK